MPQNLGRIPRSCTAPSDIAASQRSSKRYARSRHSRTSAAHRWCRRHGAAWRSTLGKHAADRAEQIDHAVNQMHADRGHRAARRLAGRTRHALPACVNPCRAVCSALMVTMVPSGRRARITQTSHRGTEPPIESHRQNHARRGQPLPASDPPRPAIKRKAFPRTRACRQRRRDGPDPGAGCAGWRTPPRRSPDWPGSRPDPQPKRSDFSRQYASAVCRVAAVRGGKAQGAAGSAVDQILPPPAEAHDRCVDHSSFPFDLGRNMADEICHDRRPLRRQTLTLSVQNAIGLYEQFDLEMVQRIGPSSNGRVSAAGSPG